MGPIERLRRDWRYFRGLLRTLAKVRSIKADSANLICDDLEAAVDRWRDRRAIEFHGAALTYGEMDAMANRYAAWSQAQGLERGDVVALFLPNRLEYLPIWYGLASAGYIKEYAASVDLPALYYALKKNADYDPDPKTGENRSISSAFMIEAVPAFLLPSEAARTALATQQGMSAERP